MQNNVTELSQKLLRSLDSNYNVIDMPAVIEIISLLEKTAITKELLETTRLGRHVNELRRNTKNESLAKRAKGLLKKWRELVLPEANGQLKSTISANANNDQADLNLNQVKSRKRVAKDKLEASNAKWSHLNGQHSELELSDNSNSSFFDQQQQLLLQKRREVIVVNDDSNSSIPERMSDAGNTMDVSAPAEEVPQVLSQQPKKRGRKKGSKNHTALIVEAATSFTNKMNATRNTDRKVKTTQELLADIQNKSTTVGTTTPGAPSPASSTKPAIEDMNVRAAKLTERVSIIDQKLNANQRYKNATQRKGFTLKNVTDRGGIREDGSRSSYDRKPLDVRERDDEDDVVVIVDDDESKVSPQETTATTTSDTPTDQALEPAGPQSLSVEEALSLLPAIDKSCLYVYDSAEEYGCTCQVAEPCPKGSPSGGHGDDDVDCATTTPPTALTNNNDPERTFIEAVEDPHCAARHHLTDRYKLSCVNDASVTDLLTQRLPSVNGNFSSFTATGEEPDRDDRGLFVNVVPKNEEVRLPSAEPPSENYKKYSISNADHGDSCAAEEERCAALTDFREWHETLDVESYGGETFRILPYVIID